MEYYFAGEHLKDPMNMGKNYGVEDITQMLSDLEDYSTKSSRPLDQNKILSEEVRGLEKMDETIYNIVVAECLRGMVFNQVGDVVNICLKMNSD